MILFFWLLVAHSLADYPLQGQFLSDSKRSGATTLPWWIALTAHSLIHAGAVALLTGSIALGLAEFFCHWLIDYAKCNRRFGDAIDQGLHVSCKVIWSFGDVELSFLVLAIVLGCLVVYGQYEEMVARYKARRAAL